MRTVVVASQKGGVGKTTIAGHLGVMAELSGDGPVALIDTDPQGSLASWCVEFGFKLSRRFGLNLARQKAAFVQIG